MDVTEPATMRTRYGNVRVRAFRAAGGQTHLALWTGDVTAAEPVLRVQSHCLTSTALSSIQCDCAEQIDRALFIVTRNPPAILLYLDQEARGHGLFVKIQVIHRHTRGRSLQEAQRLAGAPQDKREYEIVPEMLTRLSVTDAVHLLTDDQRKAERITRAGVNIASVLPFSAFS